MNRLTEASRQGGITARISAFFTRRQLRQLAGRETERMLDPLQLYGYTPGLLRAYGSLEKASAKLSRVEPRIKNLAELKTATLTGCEYCIDLGSAVARRSGLTDEQLLALPSHSTSPLFSPLEKLVLDFAASMTRTPVDVSDELYAQLRSHFDEAELIEIAHRVALENMRGRLNHTFGIGASGFSEGTVCAVPERQREAPSSCLRGGNFADPEGHK